MKCASFPGSYVPRMRLTYLVLHVQCGCNTGLSIYPSLLPPDQASRMLCSRRGTLAQSASVDDVVVLQVVGILSYDKYDMITIDRPPSDCATCKANATVSQWFNYSLLGNQQ